MSPSTSFLRFITGKVRRQEAATEFPAACYDDCNAASLAAQSTNQTSTLCTSDSPFMTSYSACTSCITRTMTDMSSNSTNSTTEMEMESFSFPPEVSEAVKSCSEEMDSDMMDVDKLLASLSSLTASQSAIQESLASLGHNVSSTATASPSGGGGGASEAEATATGEANNKGGDESGANVGVIVPAVVVPVIAVTIGVLIAWALMRRRKKRGEMETETGAVTAAEKEKGDEDTKGMAQLHGESYMQEMDGDGAMVSPEPSPLPKQEFLAELPAREPVGSELGGGGRRTS